MVEVLEGGDYCQFARFSIDNRGTEVGLIKFFEFVWVLMKFVIQMIFIKAKVILVILLFYEKYNTDKIW